MKAPAELDKSICILSISVLLNGFLPVFCQPQPVTDQLDSLLHEAQDVAYENYRRSDSLYQQAERIIISAGIRHFPLYWIGLHHQRATLAFINEEFSLCEKYLTASFQELQSFEKSFSKPTMDSLKNRLDFIHGLYYRSLGRYDDALSKLSQVENYHKSMPVSPEACRTLFQVTQYQASIYEMKGEFESAINQYIASIEYYNCYRDKNKCPNYVLIYRNIGQAFQNKGDHQSAHQYFREAKANLDTCLKDPSYDHIISHTLILYRSIAEHFILTRNMDSAKVYFQLAIPLLKDYPAANYRIYNGLAKVALYENNFQKAADLFNKTLGIFRQSYGEKNAMTARVYQSIAELYLQRKMFDKAVFFSQRSLSSLSYFEDVDIHNFAINPSLKGPFLKREMFQALAFKANVLTTYYHHQKKQSFLMAAREANLLAISLLDSTRNEFSLEKDKMILGDEAVRVYETSIQIASLLYTTNDDFRYAAECFELMDKSKSAVLLDHLKLVRNFSRIPGVILERERQLKTELTVAENKIFESGAEEKAMQYTQTKAFSDLKKAHALLFQEIKSTYPGYYKLRIANNAITLSDVRTKVLAPGQGLVEYFIGDTTVFMVCITQNGASVYVSSADSLYDQVVKLRESIPGGSKHGIVLKKQVQALYRKLVTPWINELDKSIQSLVIIPHGILSYIPFEMLTNNDAKTYLVDRFQISYATSASLLSEQKQMRVSGKNFAAFNADYTNQQQLVPLKASLSEIKSIKKLFAGNCKTFLNATADNFRVQAPQYKVLHLALHSFVNDDKPLFSRLVFTSADPDGSNEITANELYAMELNAELAVLSACESGIGLLHGGEGMMSLSRAFMYAGVPSTVMSLWKVPDVATSLLMEKFYRMIKSGQKKDEALANAKREFRKDYPEMASPYYWAGFVMNGKTDAVAFTGTTLALSDPYLLLILFFVLSLLLFLVLVRHRRNSNVSGVR
jgi:CHAT domain-containing protein